MSLTLEQCQEQAVEMGLTILEDHAGEHKGYWIVDPVTLEGPWADENFSESLEEVAGKLCALEYERQYGEAL